MSIFCNVPLAQRGTHNNGLRQWPRGYEVTWNVVEAPQGFSVQSAQQIYDAAFNLWSAVSGWRHRYISNARNANVIISMRAIDGRAGVLAEAQLPWTGITRDTQLQVWFDRRDGWTDAKNWQQTGRFPLPVVGLHEFGHTKGIGHEENGATDAIMDPQISHLTDLQGWDIDQSVMRYGLPSSNPEPRPNEPEDLLERIARCLDRLSPDQRAIIQELLL